MTELVVALLMIINGEIKERPTVDHQNAMAIMLGEVWGRHDGGRWLGVEGYG